MRRKIMGREPQIKNPATGEWGSINDIEHHDHCNVFYKQLHAECIGGNPGIIGDYEEDVKFWAGVGKSIEENPPPFWKKDLK